MDRQLFRMIATFGHRKFVEYNNNHWRILKKKRKRAMDIMSDLLLHGLDCIVYGSVARGDVSEKSDIDIFIPQNVPSYKVELALECYEIIEKRIVQATPNHAIKGEIVLEENTTVSFPLVKMKERELDFYKFGGCLNYNELLKDKRVAGVDKRLVLIIPKERGHEEIPLTDVHPSEVARFLGISIDVVYERIRVLTRRREIGRTGIFLCEFIPINESFELALKRIISRNPAIRRRL